MNKNTFSLTVLAFLLAFSFGVAFRASAATYYVATTGNDANTCTQAKSTATPKKTISSGASCLLPGDTLYIRQGVYVGYQFVNMHGTANAWITVKSYPGETATINVKSGDGGGFGFDNSSYIEIADMELTNPSFSYAGNNCSVMDTACQRAARLCDITTTACQEQYGGLNDGKGEWTTDGVGFRHADHIIVRNMNIHDFVGSGMFGGSVLNADGTQPQQAIQILNNHIHNLGRRGMFNTSYCTYITGSNYTIRGNVCHDADGSDGMRIGSAYGPVGEQLLTNSIIENNISYNNGGEIIYVYADSSSPNGLTWRQNDMGTGFTFNGKGTNNIIRNNIAYNNRVSGFAWCGPTAGELQIYNNVAYGNGSSGMGSGCGDKSTLRNNIAYGNNVLYGNGWDFVFYNGDQYHWTFGTAGVETILSNNLYNNIFVEPSVINPSAAITYTNNIVGQDPRFVNAAARDFHLQSNSSAINAGVNVGLPYIGSAPDIGACEYGNGLPCPPSVSGEGPAPTPPPASSTCTNLLNSSIAVPTNFGASFNWFTNAKELLMNVICSGSGDSATSATANIGNGSNTQYIYKTGYVWQNGAWSLFNYSGSNMDSGGNWFIGSANHSLGTLDLTQKQSVLSYICEWNGTKWNCGCHDSSCTTGYWNLQQFKQ